MKNLIILLLLGVIGWIVWNTLTTPIQFMVVEPKPPNVQDPASPPIEEPVLLPPAPTVRSSELTVLRGRVVKVDDEILILNCGPDPEPPHLGFSGANVGAAGAEALAKWAISVRDERILNEFGLLQVVSNGVMRPANANRTPKERFIGSVAVYGYPQKASRVHVVAAPTGTEYEGLPLYSVNFQIGSVSPTLQRNIFPPGVDTPEQRREYLKTLVEARKSRSQSPSEQRRTLRDRQH